MKIILWVIKIYKFIIKLIISPISLNSKFDHTFDSGNDLGWSVNCLL